MQKHNHIAGEGNTYYTLFREYDPILGRWWSADPMRDKYVGMSPYLAFGANPVRFVDLGGDSVNVDAVYRKDENGNLKYPQQAKALEVWFNTSEGYNYLKDIAQKDFSFTFQCINKGTSLTFNEEGKLSKQGVDITFITTNLSDHFKTWHSADPSASGHADSWIENGRFKGVALLYNYSIYDNMGSILNYGKINFTYNDFGSELIGMVCTWMHETWYHLDLEINHFLKTGEHETYSNHFYPEIYNTMFYRKGISVLNKVSNYLGIKQSMIGLANLWFDGMWYTKSFKKDFSNGLLKK